MRLIEVKKEGFTGFCCRADRAKSEGWLFFLNGGVSDSVGGVCWLHIEEPVAVSSLSIKPLSLRGRLDGASLLQRTEQESGLGALCRRILGW